MTVDNARVGELIALLRKAKELTQGELGERLQVSYQAVSKWERGETLPDVALLPDLAEVLDTTVDHILSGGRRATEFKGKVRVKDICEGIYALERVGLLLGRENMIYRAAIDGLSTRMNSDIEAMFADDFLRECLITEATIQRIRANDYVDYSDIKINLKHEKWHHVLREYLVKYGML